MAEIAIISSRKSKLKRMAADGNKNAKRALELSSNPNRFLSTTQIGITLVGIFAGAYGEASIANLLSAYILRVVFLAPYSHAIAFVLVVIGITYLSLVIGEIVPKRLGLAYPEKIALAAASPMNRLSKLSSPIVTVLSASTDWILRLMRLKAAPERVVEEEEIRHLIREGAQHGILDRTEKDILERTFQLADKKASSLMTPRKEVVWIDQKDTLKTIKGTVKKHAFAHFPVCNENVDTVVGIIRTEEFLLQALRDGEVDVTKLMQKPLFIPESMDALRALEEFKQAGLHIALIVDEYGSIQGLVTVSDILTYIVGEIPTAGHKEPLEIVKRGPDSWLVDGLVSIDTFKEYFQTAKLPGEHKKEYHTVAGMIMYLLKRIPSEADCVEWGKFKAEVVDMDGNRIDKILLTATSKRKRLLSVGKTK